MLVFRESQPSRKEIEEKKEIENQPFLKAYGCFSEGWFLTYIKRLLEKLKVFWIHKTEKIVTIKVKGSGNVSGR